MQHFMRLDRAPATGAVVVDIDFQVPDGMTPGADIYTPDFAATLVPYVAGTQVGFVQQGDGTFAAAAGRGPELKDLVRAVLDAGAAATNAIAGQVAPDQTHLAGYLNAAAALGADATVPTADPLKGAFTALAKANGYGADLPGFARLVIGVASISLSLSAVLTTLNAAAAEAKAPADLAEAITAFESSLADLVGSLNGAGLTITIEPPPPISIPGVNA